jgi:hypothetical protein
MVQGRVQGMGLAPAQDGLASAVGEEEARAGGKWRRSSPDGGQAMAPEGLWVSEGGGWSWLGVVDWLDGGRAG